MAVDEAITVRFTQVPMVVDEAVTVRFTLVLLTAACLESTKRQASHNCEYVMVLFLKSQAQEEIGKTLIRNMISQAATTPSFRCVQYSNQESGRMHLLSCQLQCTTAELPINRDSSLYIL